MLGIVVVKLVNTPDAAGLVERRQGAWIALGVTGIMASSANTICSAPLLRRNGRPEPLRLARPRGAAALHVFDTPGPTPEPEPV